MTTLAVAVDRPLAVAVICTVSGPVCRPLFTSVAVKRDGERAGGNSDRGRQRQLRGVAGNERHHQRRGEGAADLHRAGKRLAFPAEAGSHSAIVASSSKTSIVAEPLVQFSICAVTVTGIGLHSITWSSRSVAVKLALVCPAGSVTVAGTVRWVVPLEVKCTAEVLRGRDARRDRAGHRAAVLRGRGGQAHAQRCRQPSVDLDRAGGT